jgi:hypothetical protein
MPKENNLMNDFSQKFGDISSSNLVEPMKVFDPTKALKEFEKNYKKKGKQDGSKEGE